LSSYEAILFRRKAAQQSFASRKTGCSDAVPAIRSSETFPPRKHAEKSWGPDRSLIHGSSG